MRHEAADGYNLRTGYQKPTGGESVTYPESSPTGLMQRTFSLALLLFALPGAEAAEPPAPKAPPTTTGLINEQLPKWIRLSGEVRFREEGFLGNHFAEGEDDMYLLQRFRLGVQLQPLPWLHGFVQGQDSRVSFNSRVSSAPPLQDSADLRQAWMQIGRGEKGAVNLRVGRQELAYGEERLVGAGNWGNIARSFDAVKLVLRHGGYHADVFAASVVVPSDHNFDRHRAADNLHGIYSGIESLVPGATVEPYVFWRISPLVRREAGGQGRLDTKTAGIRWNGKLLQNFEYTTEMVLQRGSWAGDSVSAWAGLWRFGRVFPSLRWQPRVRVEANHASGDSNPADGRNGTFHVLYPTPHDKYGLADQVGWQNLNHIGVIGELRPRKSLVLQFKAHDRWLAAARDGLYNAGGALLVRDPTGRAGTHIGKEVDVQMLWTPAPNVLVGTGLGHMFPGEFLRRTTPGHSYTFPYVMITYGL